MKRKFAVSSTTASEEGRGEFERKLGRSSTTATQVEECFLPSKQTLDTWKAALVLGDSCLTTGTCRQ